MSVMVTIAMYLITSRFRNGWDKGEVFVSSVFMKIIVP